MSIRSRVSFSFTSLTQMLGMRTGRDMRGWNLRTPGPSWMPASFPMYREMQLEGLCPFAPGMQVPMTRDLQLQSGSGMAGAGQSGDGYAHSFERRQKGAGHV